MTALDLTMEKVGRENRAALIAYIPAGFPTLEGCKKIIDAFVRGGVDVIEIGFPYSDPVMDGPTIQEASVIALKNGTGAAEVLEAVSYAASKVPTVVMSYWNPIEKYGTESFAHALCAAGGSGAITPDLTIEEAAAWKSATDKNSLNRIYVVAPSSTDERLKKVSDECSGFIYAASLMGVTGARSDISTSAGALVARLRKVSDKPIAVGLGVSTREQAREVAAFADGVIVGSAFVKEALNGDIDGAVEKIEKLAHDLSQGVREGR